MNLKLLTLRPSPGTKVPIETRLVLSAHLLYKEVRRQTVHGMGILNSGCNSEASEAIGSNALEWEIDREVKADSSTQPEVEVQNNSPSYSGEHSTLSW